MNFRQPDTFKYSEDKPYVSTGMNRNTKKGEKYVGPWGDLAEFNDLFMRHKNGLGIDEFVPSSCYIARKNYIDLLDINKQKVKLVGNTLKSKKMPIYIEKFIDSSVRDLLNDRGRLSIITFHSLEDRIVKNKFRDNENPCTCPTNFPVCVCGKKSKGKNVTRKPIVPSEEEIGANKRSKSSKLRSFERRF